MDCSFDPSGRFFVFDASGKTLIKGLRSRRQAVQWIYDKHFPPKRRNHGPSDHKGA